MCLMVSLCYNQHMNENIIESLTKYIFANFNSYHGGDSDFEKFGIKLVQVAYPEAIVRQSSGSDAGGDGGRDGIAVINGEEYKIACSIDKNVKGKIRHEASLKKAYHGKMVYCTTQIVAEKVKIVKTQPMVLDITLIGSEIIETNTLLDDVESILGTGVGIGHLIIQQGDTNGQTTEAYRLAA